MERSDERDLEILNAIDEGAPLTQRALSQRLGIALGLTNLYLKRLAVKGYIKISQFPRKPAARKRLQYLLTPAGIREKSRLTYEHAAYAIALYRRTRETLRKELGRLPKNGATRVALYGTDEAAELAYLTLKEGGIEPAAVFGARAGGEFIGMPVRDVADVAEGDWDAVVVATFERPESLVAKLAALGVAPEKILTLRPVERRVDDGRLA
jgi:DNA-binding Lrp family transcriptional regulator